MKYQPPLLQPQKTRTLNHLNHFGFFNQFCKCSASMAYEVIISLFDGLIFTHPGITSSESSTIKPELNSPCSDLMLSYVMFHLQSATKWVETLRPKLGYFMYYWHIAFPPPSSPCNIVLMFELPKEKNKQPTLKGGAGEGWGFFCSLKLPFFVADCRLKVEVLWIDMKLTNRRTGSTDLCISSAPLW